MIKLNYPPKTYAKVTLTRAGRVYKAENALEANKQHDPIKGPYSIYIAVRPPMDRDNQLHDIGRPVIDVLKEAGIIKDTLGIDAVNDLRIQRFNPVKGGSVEVLVSGVTE